MAERVPFRGGLTCSCVVASLPWVEKELQMRGLLTGPLRIFQLGYRTDVDASAGTHARGGCVDVDGTPTAAEIDVWRLWGWTMQARFLSGVAPHCHGWPYKCTHLSPAAQSQEADWDRKDAGLVGGAQVQGRWPVKPWHIALRERKPTLEEDMPLSDSDLDKIRAVVKAAVTDKIRAIVKEEVALVWEADVIPNVWTPEELATNPTYRAKNALAAIGRNTVPIDAAPPTPEV